MPKAGLEWGPHSSMVSLSILIAALAAAIALGGVLNSVLLRRRLARNTEDWRSGTESLRGEVTRIAGEWRERDQSSSKTALVPNGFNMNRRPEAVRRLHSGMQVDRIAAGTGWSIPEVALLQKVERMAEAARIPGAQ